MECRRENGIILEHFRSEGVWMTMRNSTFFNNKPRNACRIVECLRIALKNCNFIRSESLGLKSSRFRTNHERGDFLGTSHHSLLFSDENCVMTVEISDISLHIPEASWGLSCSMVIIICINVVWTLSMIINTQWCFGRR